MTAARIPAMLDDAYRFAPVRGADGNLFYNSAIVCHVTGATYRQLDYWCRSGLLADTANGSGTVRVFTERDVDLIHAVLGLIRAGFTVSAAFRVGQDLVDTAAHQVTVADIYQLTIQIATPKEPAMSTATTTLPQHDRDEAATARPVTGSTSTPLT